ncbi:MAG TPA: alpha/beta hydrolase, partial [Jatrophihabitantaceae bacterium]
MGRIGNLGLALTTRLVTVPPVGSLPPGHMVDLSGRGTTFVTDSGAPRGDRPEAPPVFLLHALACTGVLTWYPSLPALSKRYRTITFDQRWHGRGIRSPHFDLDDLADDVVAVADACSVDRFVVAGYSMGSLVAQLVARRHPDRVAGLVLGASTMRFRRGAAEPLAARAVSARLRLMAERKLRGAPFGTPLADISDANRWALAQFRSTSTA